MADINDLYFFGDDFDTILDILEDEEGLDEQFTEAADDVEPENVTCEICLKKCKSKRGLKRHQTMKHKDQRDHESEGDTRSLTFETFSQIVERAKVKIAKDSLYPDLYREEIRSSRIQINVRDSEFIEVKNIYDRLLKSGNAERYYSSIYSTLVKNAATYFNVSRDSATLLATKVADCMLCSSKEEVTDIASTCQPLTSLSEEERAGLQYVGGYVFHKLHKKLSRCKQQNEQALSIIKAGKSDDMDNTNRLTSILNRGGLWAITKNAELIFERSEHYFRVTTSNENVKTINIPCIISKSVHDVDVVSAFNGLLSDAELVVQSSVAKDILHSIIQLYIKVRSFSFAKDIIQKHKMKLKQLKSKALRKDITRASNEQDQDRQS